MKAIVYVSNTGHCAQYAGIVGEKTGLEVYTLQDALKTLPSKTEIIYMGWLCANNIKGYKKANKKFCIKAVCAIGLCDTGTGVLSARKTNAIPDQIPLFTIQGGIDKTKLSGINKYMINTLIKFMTKKQNKTQDDERMLYLLENDENYVSVENVTSFMEWYSTNA